MALIEADLRALSAEARKADNLGHQLTAIFTQSDLSGIKDSAERAVLRLRSIPRDESPAALRDAGEVLQPLLLACDTKNAKLAILGLTALHKLILSDAVSSEGRDR